MTNLDLLSQKANIRNRSNDTTESQEEKRPFLMLIQ